jgi:hypothetical protein
MLLIIHTEIIATKTHNNHPMTLTLQGKLTHSFTNSSLQVHFELFNPTNQPLYVCHYRTPLESLQNKSVFKIVNTANNETLLYCGQMRKRLAPGPNNFLKVDAGSSISNTIDIAEGYEVANRNDYTIDIDNSTWRARTDPNDESTELDVNIVCDTLEIHYRL